MVRANETQKDEQRLGAEILTSDNLWSKGWCGSVKHSHTLILYTLAPIGSPMSFFCTEILFSGREVILLQEITLRKGCLPQEVTWWDCVARAPVSTGGISLLSTWACSTGSKPAVNPLTSSSSARVPKALSGLHMGSLIGLQIPHNTTSCAY